MHVPKKSKTKSLGDALREAVIHSELTPYKIAKAAGIQANVLTRFLNGERDLRLATAGKVASVLGLEFRPKKQTSQGG